MDSSSDEDIAYPEKEEHVPQNPFSQFKFFSLPYELRLRIYEICLVLPRAIDLKPANKTEIVPLLQMLRTNRLMYEEAYPVFYGKNTFQIFPTNPAHLYARPRKLLLKRVPKTYREQMTSLQLCFGPGWGSPPKCQVVKPNLGLADCTAVKSLKLFVQCDPSQDVFKNFRNSKKFYTEFCGKLMMDVLLQIPSIKTVHLDAYPSVKKSGALVRKLVHEAEGSGKQIAWAPSLQYDTDEDDYADGDADDPIDYWGDGTEASFQS